MNQIADLTASDYIESTWNALQAVLPSVNEVLDSNPANAFVKADTAISTSSFVASESFNTSVAFSTSTSTNFNDAAE